MGEGIKFEDRSGQPRGVDELIEAWGAIRKELVMGEPRPIMVFYPTIIAALAELIEVRNASIVALAKQIEEDRLRKENT